jgi:ribosome-associated protein
LETTTLLESPSTTSLPSAEERALLCARVAGDNKAKDVVVLDLRQLTPLYDFFVIATGQSRRQMHAIADEIEAAMRSVGDKRISMQGYQGSRWIVQDFGDVMVHVFDQESREYYALDELWADGVKVDWH